MKDNSIPEPVRQFLRTHIDSIEQLGVLLLLRASADREWGAEGVNRELGSSVLSIRDRLAVLASMGLLVAREERGHFVYRYAPVHPMAKGLIDGLATAYQERRSPSSLMVSSTRRGEAALDAMVNGCCREEKGERPMVRHTDWPGLKEMSS